MCCVFFLENMEASFWIIKVWLSPRKELLLVKATQQEDGFFVVVDNQAMTMLEWRLEVYPAGMQHGALFHLMGNITGLSWLLHIFSTAIFPW